jgi:membrane-bound acyltransferase YfiQ involved in biofilm formation
LGLWIYHLAFVVFVVVAAAVVVVVVAAAAAAFSVFFIDLRILLLRKDHLFYNPLTFISLNSYFLYVM